MSPINKKSAFLLSDALICIVVVTALSVLVLSVCSLAAHQQSSYGSYGQYMNDFFDALFSETYPCSGCILSYDEH